MSENDESSREDSTAEAFALEAEVQKHCYDGLLYSTVQQRPSETTDEAYFVVL